MKRLVFALLAVALVGCAGSHNDRLARDLRQRAAFDLDCQQVNLIELSRSGRIVNSYGVTGCGKRATYVLNMEGMGTWVMNSGGEEAVGERPR